MPRYYFHTADGRCHPDTDGLELSNVRAAQAEALRTLGQLVQEHEDEFWRDEFFKMTVTNEDGLSLFILDLCATFAPALPKAAR